MSSRRNRLAPPGRAGRREEDEEGDEGDNKGKSGSTSNEKLQVAVRIRPMRSEEKNRGFRVVAEKVDDKVSKAKLSLGSLMDFFLYLAQTKKRNHLTHPQVSLGSLLMVG